MLQIILMMLALTSAACLPREAIPESAPTQVHSEPKSPKIDASSTPIESVDKKKKMEECAEYEMATEAVTTKTPQGVQTSYVKTKTLVPKWLWGACTKPKM